MMFRLFAAGRLNGTVPFLVKDVQLDKDNYNTIFNDMIQWQ